MPNRRWRQKSYERALGFGPSPTAEKGLGWALAGIKDYEGALFHFGRARDAYEQEERIHPRPLYLDAMRGLIKAHAGKGECDIARKIQRDVLEEAPGIPAPMSKECDAR